MPTERPRRLLTPRDVEILAALDRTPLTGKQLLKISRMFALPFGSERMVRERLHALCVAGWVRADHYAVASRGSSPKYYQLTRTGYAILYGASAAPPTRRYFAPVSVARQFHTRCLADFLVHTIVAAHRANATFTAFYRENTLRLDVASEAIFPDAAFHLLTGDGLTWSYFVELDNGTERLRSRQDADSWQRKIRLYEQHLDDCGRRFRVLVVTTRCGQRGQRILDLAAGNMRHPQRALFYSVSLDDYLQYDHPIRDSCFRDQRGLRASLLPLVSPSSSWPSLSQPAAAPLVPTMAA